MNRRELLQKSAALVTTFSIGHHFARAAEGNPFTLGVASGSPSPDGFVLWTRLAPMPLALDGLGGMEGAVPVTWTIAADDAMRKIVQSGTIEANSKSAHSVHVEVSGLQPNRPYWYRFTALGAQSSIGRSRTTPTPNAQVNRMRFAFASCSNWQVGYFSAYRHMAEEDPDLVIFLGDYIYESTYTGNNADRVLRPHDGPTAADLTGYRNRYALYHTDPDLQALHASAPCLMTWDDHEVENDYASEWSQRTETSLETFRERRAAAYQAYYEHMPLRTTAIPRGSSLRLYDRFRFGNLATFTMLDGRQYRTKQPCETPRFRGAHLALATCEDIKDPNRSLLGAEQEQWLFDGFKQTDAAWNILGQEQLVAKLRQQTRSGEPAIWTDGWDGYPGSRQRMLDAIIANRVANPVFIGGDIHSYWATDLKANFDDPKSPTVATEFVGTSITSDPSPHETFARLLPENPHVRYFESRHRGYVAVDLTSNRMETRFQVISDRRDAKAKVSTLQRFAVESGRPTVVQLP